MNLSSGTDDSDTTFTIEESAFILNSLLGELPDSGRSCESFSESFWDQTKQFQYQDDAREKVCEANAEIKAHHRSNIVEIKAEKWILCRRRAYATDVERTV